MAAGPAGRRLAVLGHPVAHSRSPAMQNAALRELGLGGWSYEAIDVPPDRFEELVRSLPESGFAGANVTVPHKGAALTVAEELSEVAREVGAANTLAFEDGVVHAYNTDAAGLLAALPEPPEGRRALVLGAGGAARAVVWALVREGARVDVWNRTALRSSNLCEELGGSVVEEPDAGGYELIVNSTAVGLGGEDPFRELPLTRGGLHAGQTVVDLVYGAEPTVLAQAAREAGAQTVDGIEVLIRQGAESLRIWTGREPPIDTMRAAARATAPN
jgi:shikimate dehydrogenase